MGCDIHGPEVWGIRSWGTTNTTRRIASLQWDRDYACFGAIAGVRDDGVECVAQPRGFPEAGWFAYSWDAARFAGDSDAGIIDSCEGEHLHHYNTSVCHSASWLSTAEVAQAQKNYVDVVYHPSNDLALALVIMRTAESLGYTDVRLLFCFDS